MLVRVSRLNQGQYVKASLQRKADVSPQLQVTLWPLQVKPLLRLHSGWISLLLPLWAIVPSQGVDPAAWGAHITQGAACGHPAEAVGAVAGSEVVAVGPEAQGLLEALSEAAGHEAVEHGVGRRAEVEEDARDDMHMLKGQAQAICPL